MSITLGQKVRTLRKERNMTQAELAGDVITRNMLSRIESDLALPSLPTLLHIAKKLHIPAGYFLDDTANLFVFRKVTAMPIIKKYFTQKKYKDTIRLWKQNIGETDDEIALLLAETYIACALESVHAGKLKSAADEAQSALYFAALTIYPTAQICAKAELIRAVTANIQAPHYEIDQTVYLSLTNTATDTDFYYYLIEQTPPGNFSDAVYADHLAAKDLMKQGRITDALPLLEALEERKMTENISVFLLFRVYADIEHCHRELRNFELAYRYSNKRISLLSAFAS